jgi:hypothetical protein
MIYFENSRATSVIVLGLATIGLVLALGSSAAAEGKPTRCHLNYDISGWSFIYKTGNGTGKITCADGQSLAVKITTHAGGFTLGTQGTKKGKGRFSGTLKVEDLLGTYIEVDAHVGVGEDAAPGARAMFKGSKRLSLTGIGDGITIGIAFGGFTIAAQ